MTVTGRTSRRVRAEELLARTTARALRLERELTDLRNRVARLELTRLERLAIFGRAVYDRLVAFGRHHVRRGRRLGERFVRLF